MSDWWNKLFGSRLLSPGQEGVRFEFALDVPAWAWALIAMACIGAALWCYWRMTGSRVWRTGLASLRALTLMLLALLIAGPRLVRQPERIERDWVVFMADRSESMMVADVGPAAGRVTRDRQLRDSLAGAGPALAHLADNRSAMWMGFDAGAFDLPAPMGDSPAWPAPTGRRTDLSRPLEQALQRIAARPVSGIVVFSDGRLASPTTRAVVQRLQAEQIPVFVVPLGSEEAVPDLAIDRVDAPSRAFIDDIVPVNVKITRSGTGEGSTQRPGARVRLAETGTGVVLDERSLDDPGQVVVNPDGSIELGLSARPTTAGKLSWTVRIDTDTPDLTQDNNSRVVNLELTDRPIRVVYFDGYPRWEYRYMRGLLVREHSIRSSTLLLSASRRYLQEGSEPLVSVPTSAGDWGSIDVVVIGDVRAELFSHEQLENLKNHIARGGAGLLWIGGEAATPATWRSTPLADLLPFSMGVSASGEEAVRSSAEPVNIQPTPSAARLGLLKLGDLGQPPWPGPLSDPNSGWSRLWWSQRIEPERIKPTAEALAILQPSTSGGQAWPGVLTMRYGAGRTVYIATDETWRWRFGRGEALYERFWLPIIRLLARESLAATGKPALLEVAPERAVVDQPVRVSLRLVDESLADRLPAKLTVRISPTTGGEPGSAADGTRFSEITLLPENAAGDARASTFATTWTPPDAGEYELVATDAALAGLAADHARPTARAIVITPDDERRTPQTDHAALAALAEQTGGQVIPPDQLSLLEEKLPNRQVRVLGTPQIDPLWDRPGVLVVFMVLVTIEWLGRKWLRLA
ncbi:MAG: VWA domain-containing protein [Phycisphaerales bacterium]|nr:VWA domain-containing protein [Phycisphaerales bacterium]